MKKKYANKENRRVKTLDSFLGGMSLGLMKNQTSFLDLDDFAGNYHVEQDDFINQISLLKDDEDK